MNTHRLNIDLPSEEYAYLKRICALKGVSIKDFVTALILKAIEDEEDTLLAKKATHWLKNLDPAELIPAEEAFKIAGWNV